MMIGVKLKRAFMCNDNESVVVPIDTAFTKPDIDSLRAECSAALKKHYAGQALSAEYEIDNVDLVISRIINVQTVE